MSKFKEILTDLLKKITSPYVHSEYFEDIKRIKKGEHPKGNISKTYYILAWLLSEAESANDKIMLWDNIDYAQGNYLDRIGANYGVDRQGVNDVFYRLMIKIKMLAQLSGGDVDTILNATSVLFGIPPENIKYESLFPAKLRITVSSDDLPESYLDVKDIVAKQIKRVMVAGVGFELCVEIKEDLDEINYIGGAVTSQFSLKNIEPHKRLENLEVDDRLYIGGAVTTQFSEKHIEVHKQLEAFESSEKYYTKGTVSSAFRYTEVMTVGG